MTQARARVWRALRVGGIAALLLVTAYAGIVDGIDGSRSAATEGQRIAAATQMAFGVAAVAALIAMALRSRLALPILVVWGGALTVAGGLAPVVYGETGILVGLAAGLSVAVVVGLVVLAWRKHTAIRPADPKGGSRP